MRKHSFPTHYSKDLDPETGTPTVFDAARFPDNPIGGKLPPGFGEGRHYRWEPLHDPDGKWVEDEAGRRVDVWTEAKAEREAEMAETVTVSINGRTLVFQADKQSLCEVERRLKRAEHDPDHYRREWVTAGNATITLDLAGLRTLFDAIIDRNDAAFDASQAARDRIFDESKPLVRSASEAISHKGGKP